MTKYNEEMTLSFRSYVQKEDPSEPWAGNVLEREVNFRITDDLFLDDIMDKFAQFLRASGFDYVRMYPEFDEYGISAHRWVFDKKLYEDYGAYRPEDEEREINF
jgi:hypothetical protein